MSGEDEAKALLEIFREHATPPKKSETKGLLTKTDGVAKGDNTTQLNVRVPEDTKRRARLLAARDNISLSDLIQTALELYEERHGRAPSV